MIKIYYISQNLYNKIPKSNLVFKKNYELDMEKEEEENMVKIDTEDFDLFSDSALPKIILKNLGINKVTINEDKNLIIKKEEYNEEYNKELNLNKLLEIVRS